MSAKYKNGKSTIKFIIKLIKPIAEHRNISDYENKSAKGLIKPLRGSKPKLGIKKNKLKEVKEEFTISQFKTRVF